MIASREARVAVECQSPRRLIRRVRIGADKATITACPLGSAGMSGHVLLGWVHRGVHVVVSFHGVSATNIDLDLAVARHLAWVSPPP